MVIGETSGVNLVVVSGMSGLKLMVVGGISGISCSCFAHTGLS